MTTPPPSHSTAHTTASSVVNTGCLLAILYFGRAVLEPLALAAILSLMLAPLLRALGRSGLRRLHAVLLLLLVAGAGLAAAGLVLASQVADLGAELPHYRATIHHKAEQLRTLVERPMAHFAAQLDGLAPPAAGRAPDASPASAAHDRPGYRPNGTLTQLLTLAWGPLGTAGLVLVLLLFILMEQESLQDRLIRLSGHAEVSRTVRAFGDAAHGVSRFFFCQLIVNVCFGTLIGAALWLAGLPHALLWGTLSALLRFVPYIGALTAGVSIVLCAAAVDPGWGLALTCLALFGTLEVLVAHWVEPKIYGHSTGLSPLAVVVSALFWGTLWGPLGLLISTPLTVCLVVGGRHVRALEPLAILFGRAPDVTGAQRFFQRALQGDTAAIVSDAEALLRHATFARYCDQVVLPGLALATHELRLGAIDAEQQDELRCTVADIAETLAPSGASAVRRRRRVSLLEANVGAHLRHLREARLGQWQGPLNVPQGSIVLCAGLAAERDELVRELLARALRAEGIDARSVTLPLPYTEHDDSKARLVSTVFLPYPLAEQITAWQQSLGAIRALLPRARLVVLRLPADETQSGMAPTPDLPALVFRSFEECLALVSRTR